MHTHAGPVRPRFPRLTAALPGLLVVLATSHAGTGHAQPSALQASDPAHPAAPVVVPGLPVAATPAGAHPAQERSAAIAIWQRANARVAEFPRGHIDILRWEATQGGSDRGTTAAQPAVEADIRPVSAFVAQALRLRPDLIDQPGLGPQERAAMRTELADAMREVQHAWLKAVAARARLARASDALENARTGAELGRRMVEAGNWSRMRHLNELQVETAARQTWLSARMAEQVAMEQLARRLGLWQVQDIDRLRRQLPADLPAPAQTPPVAPAAGAEAAVLAVQAELQSERQRSLRLPSDANTAEWEAAHARALEQTLASESPVALPRMSDNRLLNDHRSAHAVQARARLLGEAARLRSQAREAWLALQTHHALARMAQDEILPHQEAMEGEVLQRYNGMFVSTWELLAAARNRLAALDQVTSARLAYWQAEADWRALLAGGHYAGAQDAPEGAGATDAAAGGH
jgi:hypothetical protein